MILCIKKSASKIMKFAEYLFSVYLNGNTFVLERDAVS